ncbi:MAG: JAB domain-containing protein [Polyangiaceae bacterium]|nr:JAB domain-containing protein [Polyangiaceae bacterium]
MTRVDELVREVLGELNLPEHLRPSDLLDEVVIPPDGLAEKVVALRRLVRCGGVDAPLCGRIASAADVAAYFRAQLAAERIESIWVLHLDARNRVRHVHQVARGGSEACPIEPAAILRPLIVNAAPAMLIVHNHPSGVPSPSEDDIVLTKRVRSACELVGIRLLDHVIVAAEGYFSFLDAGLLR